MKAEVGVAFTTTQRSALQHTASPDRSRRLVPLLRTLANRIRSIFLTRQFPTTRRCQLECNAMSSIPSPPFVHELSRHSSRVFRIAPRVITNKSPAAHNQSVANTVVLARLPLRVDGSGIDLESSRTL